MIKMFLANKLFAIDQLIHLLIRLLMDSYVKKLHAED